MYTRNPMRKILLALCLFFSGCLYADVKLPLDTDVNKTELGTKVGKATSHSVLWLVAWGDAGTAAAAHDGDIQTVTHLDQEVYMLLFGLYTENTTIAYGN